VTTWARVKEELAEENDRWRDRLGRAFLPPTRSPRAAPLPSPPPIESPRTA
jgi:hypothetical protein